MPPPRERLVRKAPLTERVKAYLDFHDWLLWLSEELNTNDWEDFAKDYAFIIGFVMNLVYIVAQANTAEGSTNDDILLGSASGSGWFKWFCRLAVMILATTAFFNGFFTFYKKKHYRLFEQPIETAPSTPSARRVRVDSSPAAVTPLRYFQILLGSGSAESRAHPDAGRDVWEISVWDPNPLCLDMFCLFSPLHVFIYWLHLPVPPMDQQPSVKVVTTIGIGAFLSLSLWFLRSSFANQIRDNGVIQREVLHEYDSKFVHPSTQKLYRDVGIQAISKIRAGDSSVGVRGSSDDLASEITTYTPTTIINRTWRTNPNRNYASQYDPDHGSALVSRSAAETPSFKPYSTANPNYSTASTATGADFSSPIRPSNTPNPFRQSQAPQFRPSATSGDGGSLGVFSHANSPLRKSASTHFAGRDDRSRESLGGYGVERRTGTPARREGSPLKRVSMPSAAATGSQRLDGTPSAAAERFARWNGGAGNMRRESGRF